jgi:hypothetical protein
MLREENLFLEKREVQMKITGILMPICTWLSIVTTFAASRFTVFSDKWWNDQVAQHSPRNTY